MCFISMVSLSVLTVTQGCTLAKYPSSFLPMPMMRSSLSSEMTSPPSGTPPPHSPVRMALIVTGVFEEKHLSISERSSSSSSGTDTESAFPLILHSSMVYGESGSGVNLCISHNLGIMAASTDCFVSSLRSIIPLLRSPIAPSE